MFEEYRKYTIPTSVMWMFSCLATKTSKVLLGYITNSFKYDYKFKMLYIAIDKIDWVVIEITLKYMQ